MNEYEFDFNDLTNDDMEQLIILAIILAIMPNSYNTFYDYVRLIGKYCKTGPPKYFRDIVPFCEEAKKQFEAYIKEYQKDWEII